MPQDRYGEIPKELVDDLKSHARKERKRQAEEIIKRLTEQDRRKEEVKDANAQFKINRQGCHHPTSLMDISVRCQLHRSTHALTKGEKTRQEFLESLRTLKQWRTTCNSHQGYQSGTTAASKSSHLTTTQSTAATWTAIEKLSLNFTSY